MAQLRKERTLSGYELTAFPRTRPSPWRSQQLATSQARMYPDGRSSAGRGAETKNAGEVLFPVECSYFMRGYLSEPTATGAENSYKRTYYGPITRPSPCVARPLPPGTAGYILSVSFLPVAVNKHRPLKQ